MCAEKYFAFQNCLKGLKKCTSLNHNRDIVYYLGGSYFEQKNAFILSKYGYLILLNDEYYTCGLIIQEM